MASEELRRLWQCQEFQTPKARSQLTPLELATALVGDPVEAFRSCIETWDGLSTVQGTKNAR